MKISSLNFALYINNVQTASYNNYARCQFPNVGVRELQIHVYIKHTNFKMQRNFIGLLLNKLEMYVCTRDARV